MSEELFEPRNIIVTGGCGFIGSNFVHYVALILIFIATASGLSATRCAES